MEVVSTPPSYVMGERRETPRTSRLVGPGWARQGEGHVLEICLRHNHKDDHILMYPCCIMCSLNIHEKQLVLIDNYVNYW